MGTPLILIISVFSIMVFFRIYHLKKPIYLFGFLQTGANAITVRIISTALICSIIYGLYFHYFWGFILYLIDYTIGMSHSIILLMKQKEVSSEIFAEGMFKNKKISLLFLYGIIIFWTLATIYLLKEFLF